MMIPLSLPRQPEDVPLSLSLEQAERKCYRSQGRARCRYLSDELICMASSSYYRSLVDQTHLGEAEGYACANPRDPLAQSFPPAGFSKEEETTARTYPTTPDPDNLEGTLLEQLFQENPECSPHGLLALILLCDAVLEPVQKASLCHPRNASRVERIWVTEGEVKGVKSTPPEILVYRMTWHLTAGGDADLFLLVHSGDIVRQRTGPVPEGFRFAEVFLSRQDLDGRLASLRGDAAAQGKTILRGRVEGGAEGFTVERARR